VRAGPSPRHAHGPIAPPRARRLSLPHRRSACRIAGSLAGSAVAPARPGSFPQQDLH